MLLGSVTDIDIQKRQVITGDLHVSYDYLVVATGATHSYFGKDAWAPYAPGLKRVDDATAIRRRILEAFERAEVVATDEERRRLLKLCYRRWWKPVPGLAPAAKQGGVYAAKTMRASTGLHVVVAHDALHRFRLIHPRIR